MIYELSQKLIQQIERSICDATPEQNCIIEFFRREILFPFELLTKGFRIWSKDFRKFAILNFLILIFCIFVLSKTKGTQGTKLMADSLFIMSLVVPACLSVFSSPSSYCFYGVNSYLVNDASKFLYKHGTKSSSQAKAICEIIKLSEKRIDIRLITLRGLLALSWGYILYSFNTISKYPSVVQQAEYQNLAWLIIGFSFFYVGVESYAKANDLIFKTAQFACTELGACLEEKSSEILAQFLDQIDEDAE